MTLYTKDGSYPMALVDGQVYRDAQGLSYTDLGSNADSRTAVGFTEAPPVPEFNPETHHADWDPVTSQYVVVENAPPPEPQPEIRRVNKIDFLRLFTSGERVTYNMVKAQIRGLVPADYIDPEKADLVEMEVLLDSLDATDIIELTHPETIYGVSTVLVNNGIITQPRAEEVLAGVQPAA